MIVAGPCSAETEAQVMQTAELLRDAGITYFRAGIWKPRTSPDSFEGVGEEGLRWLQRVRRETGLRTAIEVANARHVELALKHDVDLLWIGARSSVNPFTVQEIADALRGVDRPVVVKNPINPDLGLWKGALERVLRADVREVMACHRGFNVYGKSVLRNAPLWEIPIELKRQYPELPIICDPSHIAGKRAYIEDIARKALDLGYEGLMIETHPNPDEAWSDAAQQFTPADFKALMARLQFRQHSTDNPTYREQVALLRDEIDALDQKLIELLAERMDMSRRIGSLKQENNIAFYQHNRWTNIIETARELADELALNEEFVLKLFSLIHLESIDIQGE
ncbi:MAG: bifunctional 3-deoxy-7-phosphoheptulonate synthase/chorismate mutase type II [Bacteroidota bacterium]